MLMECRGIGRESGGEPSRRDEGFTVGEPAEGLREKQRKLLDLEVRRWKEAAARVMGLDVATKSAPYCKILSEVNVRCFDKDCTTY